MDLDALYEWGVLATFCLAGVAFPLLFWITVPYGGRHTSNRWGPSLPAPVAWFLMELPAPVCLMAAYSQGRHAGEPVSLLLLAAFGLHYAHRAILYPMQMRGSNRRTPVLSAAIAGSVNCINGGINGLAVGHVVSYDNSWLADPRFLIGAVVFVIGSRVNLQSDAILRKLRAQGRNGYAIPYGGLYRWVSSPNYLGEIVQWAGWALATWSAAGLAFCALTIANLAPRARSNRRWYRREFPDYPPDRRTLIPHLW
jgi:protein-S-isoprenylcysteine O-methyltransferase Ste14